MSSSWVLQGPEKGVCACAGVWKRTCLSTMPKFSHWQRNWSSSWGSAAVFIVQTGTITRPLPHRYPASQVPKCFYILRGSYYSYVSKHGPEFQWGKMAYPKSPWHLRVELGLELWIFFLAPLTSSGALDGGLWLGRGILSACKPLPQTQDGMWSRA